MRAYLSHVAVRPGESVTVHATDIRQASVRVRELQHSDPHPDGPGDLSRECTWGRATISAPRAPASVGSYATADGVLPVGGAFTISMWVWPTDLGEDSTLVSWMGEGQRWSLRLSGSRLALSGGAEVHTLDYRVRERMWNFVGITSSGSPAEGEGGASLFASIWGRTGGPFAMNLAGVRLAPSEVGLGVATETGDGGRMDGRIAGLRVHDAALDNVDLMNLMNGRGPRAMAEWDLADRSEPDEAPACSLGAGTLRLVHAPTRSTAVPPPLESTGHPLTQGGSIHFHRDDTEDCGWPAQLVLAVPQTAAPGLYSVRLQEGPRAYELPLVIVGSHDVTLLVPTLTWQAYANLGRDSSWPGLSHYSLHSDGSPVTVTTSRRPTQSFAPSARLEVDAGDGFATGLNAAHLLLADLYAWHWLQEEFPGMVGVIDDRELHLNGAEALAGVKVLVLSAHPEYWTRAMLDALDAHLAGGGSVVYLGGNGLYWVTSLHPTKPHLMEIRRWGGSQTWSIEKSDRLHQFEACTGGLWEEAGRPPNASVGIGFGGFGAGPSLEYTRTPESFQPRWSWLFEGLESDTFGAAGLNSGAGNEYDVFDPARTPPGESVVVARSVPVTPDHFGTFERGGHKAPSPDVRSDVVLTKTEAGGLVLAIGSITASGCLTSSRDTSLSTVVRNAVMRMLTRHGGVEGVDDDVVG